MSIVKRVRNQLRRAFAGSAGRRHSLVASPETWKKSRKFQREFLLSRGLAPEHRLIEIGCGTLRGGLPLIEWLDAGNYTGIEVREEALEEGRRELAEAGLEEKKPNLIRSGDFANLSIGEADFVWAYAVLIHMTDEILEECLRFVARHLAPGGQFYASSNVGSEGQAGSWIGFPVMRHSPEFYPQLAARYGLRCEDLGSLAELGDLGDEGALPEHERHMFRFWREIGDQP